MPKRLVGCSLAAMSFTVLPAQQAPVEPLPPVGTRSVHPAIAPPAAGAVRNGTGPYFQYPDSVWNHGEGFPTPRTSDRGGWFDHDDGTGVTIDDVHTPFGWQAFTWTHPTHPAGGGSGVQIRRLYGYLRPDGAGPRPDQHPLYGALSHASEAGPFGDHTYVDQGAFEIFRPDYAPTPGEKIVVCISTRETTLFPRDRNGRRLSWRSTYLGFFSPDGLIRDELQLASGQPRTADTFFQNDDVHGASLRRPNPLVVINATQGQGYYPIFAYAVPTAMHRPTELNEQRDLQLLQAIKELLREDPADGRNPLPVALTPAQLATDVYVLFEGSSNGGLQAMWSTLRHPDLVHGNLSDSMSASKQRLIGELDMKHAIARLSGSGEGGTEASEYDLMHWGQYCWNQGMWVHDMSMVQRYLRGQLHRPACFVVGDEDITGTGTDWIRLLTGTDWSQNGVVHGMSPFGEQAVNRFAWMAGENGCHGQGQSINAYTGTTIFHTNEVVHDLIPDVIAQHDALAGELLPGVASQPRLPSQELRGPDDPHEWALGRIGQPMVQEAALTRDDTWFATTQPGAAGTMLGYKESMLIRGGHLYVGSADGVVTRFHVDGSSKALIKDAHSNAGDMTAALPLGNPMALGHESFALAPVSNGSDWNLAVGTRRHLHLLDPDTLTVQKSVQIPWELARPRHLKVGDVLPNGVHPGEELMFCSPLGGLAFYDTDLNPIWEWPEPGIVDFVVVGSEVAVLSQRGVVARLEFVLGAAGPEARLLAASQSVPGQGQYGSLHCQGDPVDLELMVRDLSMVGSGTGQQLVAAWNNDGDGGAVRIYDEGLAFDGSARGLGKITDIAMTNEPTTYAGGVDGVGDHVLVLRGGELTLLDQAGVTLGQVQLTLLDNGEDGLQSYPFGNHAIAIAVGELFDPGAGFEYEDEVVVATQSGALLWLHVEEVKGALHPLPRPQFELVKGAAQQPRTNRQLSSVWAISQVDGDDRLHCLDRRGGYWTVGAAGVAFEDANNLAAGATGWSDVGNRTAGEAVAFASPGFATSLLAQGSGELNLITTTPYAPLRSSLVFFERSSRWLPHNWQRDAVTNGLFHGFAIHRRPGAVLRRSADIAQFWFWSGRGALTGTAGDWGNVVEAIELDLATDRVTGSWATVGEHDAAGIEPCPHHDLRSITTSVPIMNQQALSAHLLPNGEPVVFLGCPGGRVRALRPGAFRPNDQTFHQIGATPDKSEDLGFGGGALAVRMDPSGQATIYFGTIARPAGRPASLLPTGALDDGAVVTGAVHKMTWTSSSGFSSATTVDLPPNMPGHLRGGYGVVGLHVADLLEEAIPGAPSQDEVIVTTAAGDILVFDSSLSQLRWSASVPGGAGFFNSIRVLPDSDGTKALYVSGSFGIWRFRP